MFVRSLGFRPEDKFLIVHADDLGMTQSINSATIQAFERGRVNSGSVMVTCTGVFEIAEYARLHPHIDIGLHITLTSQSSGYTRWRPLSPIGRIQTLTNPSGYFHEKWYPHMYIDPSEVEIEIRAQIERALALGIQPTHIDSHQFVLYRKDAILLNVFLKVAREYRLPVLLAKRWRSVPWNLLRFCVKQSDIVINCALTLSSRTLASEWTIAYTHLLHHLEPGVTELIIHPGFDDEETRACIGQDVPWGASWRQRDFNFFMSNHFISLLEEQNIRLITWRQIQRLISN